MLQKFIFVIMTCLTLISTQLHAAGIQKWIDEKGQTHYGDTPPPQVKAQEIRTSKRPSVLGKPLPRFTGLSSATKSTRKNQPVENTLEPAQAAEACKNAQEDIKVIKRSSRIQLRAADGSLRYMTKEEIKQRLARSEDAVKRFCR